MTKAKRPHAKPSSRDRLRNDAAAERYVPTIAHLAGIVLLLLSSAGALMLVLQHLTGLSLPGCGPGSGCAELAAGVWGKVPHLNWPVSFLGLAYFLSVLIVWLTSHGGLGTGMRWLVRLGLLISIGFTIIMFKEGHLCPYCLLTHAGNLLFWIVMEKTRPAISVEGVSTPRMLGFARYVVAFVVCTVTLAVIQYREKAAAEKRAEENLAGATAALVSAASKPAAEPQSVDITDPEPETTATDSAATSSAGRAASRPAPVSAQKPFTGRYRLGPEKAAIRVVLVGDYQCQECKRIEGDVMRIFHERDDMSVSFKHFPMNSECNRMTNTQRHPNACWAARAAEAAGLLRGNDGFWEMHLWLYEHGGSFTNQELPPALQEMGYDVQEFVRTMSGEQTLDLIKADVEEAIALGIWFTPSIFINGVELRGWEAPSAVERAITALVATNPEPQTAAVDQPPPAVEKLIGDWLDKPLRTIPAGAAFRCLGSADAPVRVVVFGDYQHKGTGELDALIRELAAQRGDVRYEYRHFPFNSACNPVVKVKTDYESSCRAAVAGEAAGRVAGADGYWKMHVWLLEHQADYSDETFLAAATEQGLDAAAIQAEMGKAETGDAVRDDSALGGRLQAKSVPTLFVNGRQVPRWMREGENILPQIVERAARGD